MKKEIFEEKVENVQPLENVQIETDFNEKIENLNSELEQQKNKVSELLIQIEGIEEKLREKDLYIEDKLREKDE